MKKATLKSMLECFDLQRNRMLSKSQEEGWVNHMRNHARVKCLVQFVLLLGGLIFICSVSGWSFFEPCQHGACLRKPCTLEQVSWALFDLTFYGCRRLILAVMVTLSRPESVSLEPGLDLFLPILPKVSFDPNLRAAITLGMDTYKSFIYCLLVTLAVQL